MTFLPPSYTVPSGAGGNYFKLQQGKNKVRILTSPITGWCYWVVDEAGKARPMRVPELLADMPPNIRIDEKGKPEDPKHFWAMAVWNFSTGTLQVWEVTQKTIQRSLVAIAMDEDWGDPRNCNLTIDRSGEGLDTTYSVLPSPIKNSDPNEKIEQALVSNPVQLERLYEGGNPLAPPEQEELSSIQEGTEQAASEELSHPATTQRSTSPADSYEDDEF